MKIFSNAPETQCFLPTYSSLASILTGCSLLSTIHKRGSVAWHSGHFLSISYSFILSVIINCQHNRAQSPPLFAVNCTCSRTLPLTQAIWTTDWSSRPALFFLAALCTIFYPFCTSSSLLLNSCFPVRSCLNPNPFLKSHPPSCLLCETSLIP